MNSELPINKEIATDVLRPVISSQEATIDDRSPNELIRKHLGSFGIELLDRTAQPFLLADTE